MGSRTEYGAGLEGRTIGSQTIIKRAPNKNGAVFWFVRCKCGAERAVVIHKLLKHGKPACCLACLQKQQRGPKSVKWKGGKHVPLTHYHKFRRAAERRCISWELTIGDLDALYESQGGLCALTETRLVFDHGIRNSAGNASLDRKNAKEGYRLGNVQFVTKQVSIYKQSLTNDEFVAVCIAVVNAWL